MNSIKFAIDFISSVKEAADKDLKCIDEFERSWHMCSEYMNQIRFTGEYNHHIETLINGLRFGLEALKNDPLETLLEQSPNAEDEDFCFCFEIDSHDNDWSSTILMLSKNSLEVLNDADVRIGWNCGNGAGDFYDLSY